MGMIITNTNEQSIINHWKLLNTANLFLIPTVGFIWLFTPFVTKDLSKNGIHLFFRITSVVYAVAGSGGILYCSSELTKLKPKIDAINKRNQAEFKQGLASDLFVAQSTNTAIAQFLVGERQAELVPSYEPLEAYSSEEFESSTEPQDSQERTSLTVSEPNELSELAEQYLEEVRDELEDGTPESKIIKDLGFTGERYKEGRKILNEIKKYLEFITDSN